MDERLTALCHLRTDLKSRGRLAELADVQREIVSAAQAVGRAAEVASAQNYLAVVFLRLGRPADAEAASRAALDAYAGVASADPEVVGCYQGVLARALAAQGQFAAAVQTAEAGFCSYAVFHDPPDDFLAARGEELAALRRGEQPAPLEW